MRDLRSIFGRFVVCALLGVAGLQLTVGAAGADSSERGLEERLERAIARYADALEEPDRDERIAGFAEAEAGFAAVVDAGIENAALQTNLGNAALQAEHLGRAVLAYKRALRLDPSAAAARQNLAHARTRLPEWVPRPGAGEESEALIFYRRISPAARAYAAAACFVGAAGCLALSVRRREGAWRGIALTGAALWALLVASLVFDANDESAQRAVVTASEALARSADSRLAAPAYPEPLPSGVEATWLEERDEWVRVRLYNGRDVWLRGSEVTRVVE